jgi:hypothetical protein
MLEHEREQVMVIYMLMCVLMYLFVFMCISMHIYMNLNM